MAQPQPQLCPLALRIFHASGVVEAFGVPPKALESFLMLLQEAYLPNPFHNFAHAGMVLHKSFLVACKTRLCQHLSQLELFALFLAAVGHDVGHLGRTNSFEVASESPLALLYNNRSVLEQHHAATLFTALGKHNVLAGLPRDSRLWLRQLVLDMIMATDMQAHTDLLVRLEQLPTDNTEKLTAAQRGVLMQSVLHATDLHVPTLPWRSSRAWATALSEEFRAQVALERESSLPVSSFLVPADAKAHGKMESGFGGALVKPFYDALTRRLPELDLCCQMMRTNLEQWSLIATGAPPEEIDVTAQGKIVDAWEKQPVLLDRDTMMKLPPELRPAPAPAPA